MWAKKKKIYFFSASVNAAYVLIINLTKTLFKMLLFMKPTHVHVHVVIKRMNEARIKCFASLKSRGYFLSFVMLHFQIFIQQNILGA